MNSIIYILNYYGIRYSYDKGIIINEYYLIYTSNIHTYIYNILLNERLIYILKTNGNRVDLKVFHNKFPC